MAGGMEPMRVPSHHVHVVGVVHPTFELHPTDSANDLPWHLEAVAWAVELQMPTEETVAV